MRPWKLLPLLLLLPVAPAAAARRNPLAGQPAVRHRVEMRKLRLELSPLFVTSINQDFKHAFGPGLKLQFHILDWLAVGVEGAYTLNSRTALDDAVRGQLPTGPASSYTTPPQPNVGIHDEHLLGINYLGSVYAALTPFSGKISLFSALFLSYDLYGLVGFGLVHYAQDHCCTKNEAPPQDPTVVGDPNVQNGALFAGNRYGPMAGVGVHLFFNEWIGVHLELRDYIVSANPSGLDTNYDRRLTSDDESIQNNLFFGVGLTLMLPPKARISD